VPENAWDLRLEAGACLDFVPVGDNDFCVRAYGFRDTFSGAFAQETTRWLGRPARECSPRAAQPGGNCGITSELDLQQCPLFPVVKPSELEPRFAEWLFAAAPEANVEFATCWRALPRLSARDISSA